MKQKLKESIKLDAREIPDARSLPSSTDAEIDMSVLKEDDFLMALQPLRALERS